MSAVVRQKVVNYNGWGQCHNPRCGRWYRTSTGYIWYPRKGHRGHYLCSTRCIASMSNPHHTPIEGTEGVRTA